MQAFLKSLVLLALALTLMVACGGAASKAPIATETLTPLT